ncbi:protein kinase, putative [Trichomonas vaginalis G3]|uniref:Protein kinase, putative n=1 Tax=Trichomonas vaginalis (strain ATCC PRA-98 / G3) TaxID=412133 RepID=A2DFF7_TRIV3|nr:ERAD pathway [Trichomonas vaginalis G3]EAY20885.1 protein kinase, putative [Trichomonas vaginalis G3]KAI5521505.1 ERAD pathway [Trichomonas vaginalis G3]|eukprot:XP_001581871.1 protein kinase [Trichomonas vaginalis G3]
MTKGAPPSDEMLRVIQQLSDKKNHSTDLVQDLSRGLIFVLSKFKRDLTDKSKKTDANEYYKKYSTISHACLASPHRTYQFDFSDNQYIRYTMPYFLNSSVSSMIDQEKRGKHPISWTVTKKSIVAYGIAQGIKALHSQNIIHGLLTPSNVFLSRTFEPLISEFWLRELYDISDIDANTSKSFLPTDNTEILAPPYDIYSFGCILACLLHKSTKFEVSFVNNASSDPMIDLIKKCIDSDPKNRPTIEEIINQMSSDHVVFSGTDITEFTKYVNKISNSTVERVESTPIPIPPMQDDHTLADQYRTLADSGDAHAHLLNAINRRKGRGCSVNKNASLKSFRFAADAGNPYAQYQASYYMVSKPKSLNEAIAYLTSSADSGYQDAQYRLGLMYAHGEGVSTDPKLAEKYLRLAADQGHLNAQKTVIEYIMNGTLQNQDPSVLAHYQCLAAWQGESQAQLSYAKYLIDKAFEENKQDIVELLTRASDQGNNEAQMIMAKLITQNKLSLFNRYDELRFIRLGAEMGDTEVATHYSDLISSGKVQVDDPVLAAKYFKMAADKGDDRAMVQYAQILREGKGVNVDKNGCYSYLKRSAEEKHNAESAYKYVDMKLAEGNKWNSDLEKFMKMAADAGHPLAQTRWAIHIKNSEPESAKTYLENAARQNEPRAYYELADYYLTGKFMSDDKLLPARLMKGAADLGYVEAMRKYAKFCVLDKCLPTDNVKTAAEYYKMAADLGDEKSQYRYAEMLADGDTLDEDIQQAVYYFELAAKQGNPKANYALGLIYEMGEGPIQKDEKKARAYYKKAINPSNNQKGYRPAKSALARVDDNSSSVRGSPYRYPADDSDEEEEEEEEMDDDEYVPNLDDLSGQQAMLNSEIAMNRYFPDRSLEAMRDMSGN